MVAIRSGDTEDSSSSEITLRLLQGFATKTMRTVISSCCTVADAVAGCPAVHKDFPVDLSGL